MWEPLRVMPLHDRQNMPNLWLFARVKPMRFSHGGDILSWQQALRYSSLRSRISGLGKHRLTQPATLNEREEC